MEQMALTLYRMADSLGRALEPGQRVRAGYGVVMGSGEYSNHLTGIVDRLTEDVRDTNGDTGDRVWFTAQFNGRPLVCFRKPHEVTVLEEQG